RIAQRQVEVEVLVQMDHQDRQMHCAGDHDCRREPQAGCEPWSTPGEKGKSWPHSGGRGDSRLAGREPGIVSDQCGTVASWVLRYACSRNWSELPSFATSCWPGSRINGRSATTW